MSAAGESRNNRLDPPANGRPDHALGDPDAPITLVEYGSYNCPSCLAANAVIADLRDRFGDRLRYIFRHRPITGGLGTVLLWRAAKSELGKNDRVAATSTAFRK